MPKLHITDTILRDAHQSQAATRMRLSDMLPACEILDSIGYWSLECWGGATFDSCMRFLDEDPWQRLRELKKHMPNTKLQMLLRGQNLLGYKHYPDDVVIKFIERSVANGIDIIRIFDALNDLRNLKLAIETTVNNGALASGAISYTTSPVHTLENYVKLCKEMAAMGCGTICIKDMAGVITPQETHDLVSAIKDALPDLPLVLHTHSTTGMAFMSILKGVEAGCDVIDTASSCFSGGTSQPATETLYDALTQMGFEVPLDRVVLKEVNDYFKPYRDECLSSGLLKPKAMATDTDALTYKVPGGMLSNLMSQLETMNAFDRLEEVLQEVPAVRKDMGYPPLVTPMSQIVGVQATNNVLAGERYKNVTKEAVAYLRGEYGRAPGEINAELQKKVLGDEQPLTVRYADTLEPAFEKTKAELGDIARDDDDVLSYIAFPQVAERFFEERKAKEERKVKFSIEAM